MLLILGASLHTMYFVRAFSIKRALGVRLIVIEDVQNYGKILFIKKVFENGLWEEIHTSHLPPAFAPALQ